MKYFIIAFILCAANICRGQIWLGANANLVFDGTHVTDGTHFSPSGGSAEIGLPGRPSFPGYLFFQLSYVERGYVQTFPGVIYDFLSGGGAVSFSRVQTFQGRTYAAGTYSAKTWLDYLPDGRQFDVEVQYCYPIISWLIVGPLIGVAYQEQQAIPTASLAGGEPVHGSELSSSDYYFHNESPEWQAATPRNVYVLDYGLGSKINILDGLRLSLGYTVQAGAALGIDFKV